MAMTAARFRSVYGAKGYRRQSDIHPQRSIGDVMLKPGRAEAGGVAFNRFPELGDRLPKVLGDIVIETTEAVAAKADAKAPVGATGNLRKSQTIRYSRSKSTHQVVTGRIDYKATDPTPKEPKHEYAFFVEVGTIKTRAQPFLVPAVMSERLEFNAKLRNLESRLR